MAALKTLRQLVQEHDDALLADLPDVAEVPEIPGSAPPEEQNACDYLVTVITSIVL